MPLKQISANHWFSFPFLSLNLKIHGSILGFKGRWDAKGWLFLDAGCWEGKGCSSLGFKVLKSMSQDIKSKSCSCPSAAKIGLSWVSIIGFSPKIRQRVLCPLLPRKQRLLGHMPKHCHTANKPKTYSQRLRKQSYNCSITTPVRETDLPVSPKTGWEDADLVLSSPTRMLAASCRATLLPWSPWCSLPHKSWVRQDCPSAACAGDGVGKRQREDGFSKEN